MIPKIFDLVGCNCKYQRCCSDCMNAQAGLPLCCSQIPKTGFLTSRPIFLADKVSVNNRHNQAYKDNSRTCNLITESLPFHQWQESMVQA